MTVICCIALLLRVRFHVHYNYRNDGKLSARAQIVAVIDASICYSESVYFLPIWQRLELEKPPVLMDIFASIGPNSLCPILV